MIGNCLRVFKNKILLRMKVIKNLCKHMHIKLLSLLGKHRRKENISVIRILSIIINYSIFIHLSRQYFLFYYTSVSQMKILNIFYLVIY